MSRGENVGLGASHAHLILRLPEDRTAWSAYCVSNPTLATNEDVPPPHDEYYVTCHCLSIASDYIGMVIVVDELTACSNRE